MGHKGLGIFEMFLLGILEIQFNVYLLLLRQVDVIFLKIATELMDTQVLPFC